MQRPSIRRSVGHALVGAALVATFGPGGPAGPAGGLASSAAPASAAEVECDPGHSAARVARGRHHGHDPNSVTAGEARRADARLQRHVARLKRAGTLRPDGSVPAHRRFRVRTHVHVITRSDGTGGVTRQQVRDQVRVLNAGFGGRTGRHAARTPFRFKLASLDYTRNDTWFDWPLNEDGTESAVAKRAKRALHRGGWADLNIYVANLGGGLLGYANFPKEGPLALDGTVLLNESLPGGSAAPYNEGDTGTHEVGHWLSLYHTFENGCRPPGDYVKDTPYQADGENIFYCGDWPGDGSTKVPDNTCPQPGKDPVHNFMAYGDDPCLSRFTRGQSHRMIASWLAYRA